MWHEARVGVQGRARMRGSISVWAESMLRAEARIRLHANSEEGFKGDFSSSDSGALRSGVRAQYNPLRVREGLFGSEGAS